MCVARGGCWLPPAEDARLLLHLVQLHLRSLDASLWPECLQEDWGLTAQQAVKTLLKAWIVMRDGVLPAATLCCSPVRWLTLSCPMT